MKTAILALSGALLIAGCATAGASHRTSGPVATGPATVAPVTVGIIAIMHTWKLGKEEIYRRIYANEITEAELVNIAGSERIVRVRGTAGTPKLVVQLYGGDGAVLATAELKDFTGDWKQYAAALQPRETSARGWLAVVVEGRGTVEWVFFSPFPRTP